MLNCIIDDISIECSKASILYIHISVLLCIILFLIVISFVFLICVTIYTCYLSRFYSYFYSAIYIHVQIKIFINKTKAMLVTTYQRYNTLLVKDNSIIILSSQVWTLLGIIIDQNLNRWYHVNKVHKTVSMLLAKCRQIKPFLLQMPELNTANHSFFFTLVTVAVSGAMSN